MFSIFKVAKNETNLNWLKTDIHTHVLPKVGDSNLSVTQCIKMIHQLSALGLRNIYLTPHECRNADQSPDLHERAFDTLVNVLEDQERRYAHLHLAAEYMINLDFERTYQTGSLRNIDEQYVLLEMPLDEESLYLDVHLFAVQARNQKVILAHPERYAFCWDKPDHFKRYKNAGCRFQMDILSPSGYYGAEVKRTARYLLKERMVDFVGTNIHNMKDLRAVENYVLSGEAHKAFRDNPIRNNKLSNKIYA